MTDIIIGARKPRPRKSRRLLLVGLAAIAVYVALRWAISFLTSYPNPDVSIPRAEIVATQLAGQPSLTLEKGSLSRAGRSPQNPLLVLRVQGQPRELGAVSGRLLGEALEGSTTTFERAARQAHGGSTFITRFFGRRRGDWSLRHIDNGIPGHQLVEIAGLARGARASGGRVGYEELVRAQALYDLAPPHPHSAGAELRALTSALTVVAPLSGASGERLLLGHSFSLPGLSSASAPVVRFFRPTGVIAFASVGDPATVGVLSGINAEGLVVIAHPISTVDGATSEKAQPTPLLVRDILENARSAEQAVAIIEAARPLGSAIYVIADAETQSAVVVERTPKRMGVLREAKTRVVVDLLESEELADEPESERNRRLRHDEARAKRAMQVLKKRPPRSPSDLAQLLRDRNGPDDRPLPLGTRAQLADPSASRVVIIDASALVIWVNAGPGPFGRFVAFDLRHELRGEGKRPAPPPDIAADRTQATAATNVNAARALVFRARASSRKKRARETLSRALLLAPTLPEALELATELGVAIPDSGASTPKRPGRAPAK